MKAEELKEQFKKDYNLSEMGKYITQYSEWLESQLEKERGVIQTEVKFLENLVLLIDFLQWMNDTTLKNPMQLETDNPDIAMMFLTQNKSKDES